MSHALMIVAEHTASDDLSILEYPSTSAQYPQQARNTMAYYGSRFGDGFVTEPRVVIDWDARIDGNDHDRRYHTHVRRS